MTSNLNFEHKSDNQSLKLLANTVRVLSAEAVQRANSGHPGMPMGAADYAALLFSDYLRFSPYDPNWLGRDRFVLSAGHGSMLLYSLLHLFRYDVTESDLKNFRQWQSRTPGHPEFGMTVGVETTTGPLGQGVANGVGLALSEKLLQARYSDRLFGNTVYGIVSDGDLMEGVAAEAASLAGHLKLGNIVYIYDDNQISIGGRTDVCFTESVVKRFESYGWHVQSCDGHDFDQIRRCLDSAVSEKTRPSLISARTIIGLGSPNKQDSSGVHGSPLGEEELALTKKSLNWTLTEAFAVPEEVKTFCKSRLAFKEKEYNNWQQDFGSWKTSNPDKAILLDQQIKGEVTKELKNELHSTLAAIKDKEATRSLSGKAIQIIAKHVPWFIGGSADLEPSNLTLIKDSKDITPNSFSGKNIRFGVREHGMASIVNGLAYTRMWVPFGATFLVFADYMRPAIRLAALSHLQSLFIFTHDSFWVGEDGPTHEPIEHIESLRIIPNLDVYRPADGLETAACYLMALQAKTRPAALLFTRQNLNPISRRDGFNFEEVFQGAYIVKGENNSERVIVATGSEVETAIGAVEILSKEGINFRVVSAPCLEQFFRLPASEQVKIIPQNAFIVSLEAGITSGWRKLVGHRGLTIGIDHYGASAPGGVLAEKFGFTPEAVAAKIIAKIS